MEAAITSTPATLIVVVMIGIGDLILVVKWLDREARNSIYYYGMLGIVLLIGGTLLLRLLYG